MMRQLLFFTVMVLSCGLASAQSYYRAPALTDEDRRAAFPELTQHHTHADPLVWMVQGSRLERSEQNSTAWHGSAWVGHDRGRLWLRSEGTRQHGETDASIEALWGKPVDAWWDVLAGVRHEQGDGPNRTWLAVGVQGLAPYLFEVQATAYVGNAGRSMLQLEAEYELLLTNRLILQPTFEAEFHGRDDPATGRAKGVSETSAGLRMRYEIRREFAPYFGYEWSRQHGRTADWAVARGEPFKTHGWVAGVRFWF